MNSGKRMVGARTAWALAVSLTAIGVSLPAGAQNATGQSSAGQSSAGQSSTTQPAASTVLAPMLPAATPITDLLTRMDALETQVARLTAQNEELANREHQAEVKLGMIVLPAATTTMGPTLDAAAIPAAGTVTAPVAATPPVTPASAPVTPPKSATAGNLSAMSGGASDRAADDRPAGPAHPSAQRVAAVKAVIKPQTDDTADDDYSYGFRLYTAKFYPEAAQQLKYYIDKYPKDSRISNARNLLGRAYLDDGKARDAAPWFLTNYKTDPHGSRAADSLLNLAAAMRKLGDDSRACIALNEFSATYSTEAQGRLRKDYAKTRDGLTCN